MYKDLSAAQAALVQAQDPGHRQLVAEWLRDHAQVEIIHSDDTGEWLYWVVGPDNFWLDSFETLKEAKQFIKKMKLTF